VWARGQARAEGLARGRVLPQSVSDSRSGMMGGAGPSAAAAGQLRNWATLGQNSGWVARRGRGKAAGGEN
jgi:hypothetical protein